MPVRIAVGGRKKTSLPRGLYFREWPQCSGCQRETFLVAHGQWPHSLYLLQHTRPHTMPLHFIILQHKQHKKNAPYTSCNTQTTCNYNGLFIIFPATHIHSVHCMIMISVVIIISITIVQRRRIWLRWKEQ